MHELSQEEISAQPEVEDEQLELAALSDNSDYARRGIVYISRIPPGLTPSSLRDIMQQFGQVTRIYCTPQDPTSKKKGSLRRYIEGWIEFSDRKDARRVSKSLNCTPIGECLPTKKRRRVRFAADLWNLTYLGKHVKWHHLTQQLTYQKRIREKKLVQQIQQAKREANQFLDNVEKSHIHNLIEEKRRKKLNKKSGRATTDETPAIASSGSGELSAIKRNFRQKKHIKGADEDEVLDDKLLRQVFGK
jgi:ESF2/ABP1 family protein